MRLGSWIFIRTSDLTIKDYFPITMKRFIKSGRGAVTRTYVNQPFLTMKYNGGEFYVRGNRPVWSLLDSVFPHDPLPRTPINNDLKTEHGKDALEGLLTDIDAWPYLGPTPLCPACRPPWPGSRSPFSWTPTRCSP